MNLGNEAPHIQLRQRLEAGTLHRRHRRQHPNPMKLTDEQIERNAAAYIAAKRGKPWEMLLSNGWEEGTNALQRIEWWLENNHLCRPVPQPWDCPGDVPGLEAGTLPAK